MDLTSLTSLLDVRYLVAHTKDFGGYNVAMILPGLGDTDAVSKREKLVNSGYTVIVFSPEVKSPSFYREKDLTKNEMNQILDAIVNA